jgi:hypothetical protein
VNTYLSVIVFDQCLFRKKAGLQGFIKKFITFEPLKIQNCFFFIEFLKVWPIFYATSDIFFMFHMPTAIFSNLIIKKFFQIATTISDIRYECKI